MRFGICCGPGSFAPQTEGQPLASIPALMETMTEAGADYLEFAVAAVSPTGPEERFEELRQAIAPYPLKVEAFNSFIPGTHRITGPELDLARVLAYCETALRRCRALGGEVVVLGSAGARKAPEGFPLERAEEQFVQFCRELGPIAQANQITIAIEPLNRGEDNLLLSVKHGAAIVDRVAHPSIWLLADLYHISVEDEPLENVAAANGRLVHTHCADTGRVPPGFASEREENFLGFFRSLRAAGYDRRCSFEGSFTDIASQSAHLLRHLRKRWQEAQA